MNWLRKIFKSSGDSSSALSTSGRHPQFLEENMSGRTPPSSLDDCFRRWKEQEELDDALALSLTEDLKRPGGRRWCIESDDIARELQGSLHRPFYPSYVPSYPPYSSGPHYPRANRICAGCNREIGCGKYLGCMGEFFHPECFRCHFCGYPITEHEIPTNAAGLIEYRCHPFWSQKYCPSHEHDNTARCCSCERLEILRRPRIGGHQLVGMRTYPQKLIRRCDVTAILVLYGLPRLLTGAILAHELMHGWLRLKGYRNLRPEVEEGICQVLSYMWLEAEVMLGFRNMPSTSTASSSSSKKGRTSEVEKKLGEFFLHQIANDASPAYGEGFRAANAAVNKYGLRSTLHHIHLTGYFPI
ncbi:hypothetical protein Cgig2_005736 [Carnegiea gigantea]|uniref:LIM zinc-binding domain-containing protein n=1 Tax=Carnegiea gigantea TaxID=171969 RepID=A0A9Q1KHS3_9CARY|nr:hypothetical protein Cgig2_005736 [Carnegiea gigantea]